MSLFKENLYRYIKIYQPLIYIRGNDEIRIREELKLCCLENSRQIYVIDYIDITRETGSITRGLINLLDDNRKEDKVIFISNGAHILREQEMIAFITRIVAENIKISIVVMSDVMDIPVALNPYACVIDLPALSVEEITQQLIAEGISRDGSESVASKLKGLSFFEIRQAARRIIKGENIEKVTNKLTEGMSANSEFLSFVEVNEEELGGFSKLKENIQIEKPIFKNVEDARSKKIPIPKGIMLVGIPGCGKSLAAKVIAKEFEIPLLKMEFGKIMNKYVGESEANLFFALKFAESSAPCVLWLDEFEKSIVTSSESGADGNISNRLLGIFLNWLQEKSAPVYVVATVNNIDRMPPELIRRGRFDEIYEVDLPKTTAIHDIMTLQLKKYDIPFNHGSIDEQDIKSFCNELRGYSGADIEELVKTVKKNTYGSKDDISIKDFKIAKQRVKSVEIIMHEQVHKIREVFKKYNFTPVD